jgi:RNA polymerase sigma-70 factor (ECF subfamily)
MNDALGLEPYPQDRLDGLIDVAAGPAARYESREAVELAFIAALQLLTGRQRAALVLHDVLGFRAAEVAAMLESSEDGVKGALKRARATLDSELAQCDRADQPAPESSAERELVQLFVDALVTDDIDRLVTLLTDRAWLTMPPSPLEYQGPANVGAFLAAAAEWRQYQPGRTLTAPRANGQPAFALYRDAAEGDVADATALIVLAPSGTGVARINWFLGPDYVEAFGLPIVIPTS